MHAVTALDAASHRTCFETASRSTSDTMRRPLFQYTRGEAGKVLANGTPHDLQYGHHLR